MQNTSELDASFERLGDMLPDFVARYDKLCRIRYMNRSLLEALRVKLSDIAGKTPEAAWPDGRFSGLQKKIQECIDTGNVSSIDITVPDHQGGVEYHNIRLVGERTATGELCGALALGRNLTDRFLLERNLVAASRLKSLEQIASGVCHEVNNPLAIISACSKRLKLMSQTMQGRENEVIKTTQWIDQAVERISYIVQSLYILAHEESRSDSQAVNIVEAIDGALFLFRENLKKRAIELIEDFRKNPRIMVAGSRSQLSRAILNLVSNSYDAVLAADNPWIKISLSLDEKSIRIKVIDSGPALEQDTILKLTQPFFTTKKLGKGAGLGLSVASAIAESHHGRLFYDKESKHTCFVLELPQQR